VAIILSPSPWISTVFRLHEEKMTKAEKRGCGLRALTVNTPSPAALRRGLVG
jgi:hypothetical protein